MSYVRTRGLDVHFEEAGAGPNVFVFVHGNFASWRWWRPIFDRLPPGYRAYALDLRGCGDTGEGSTVDGYAIPTLADDLLAFAEGLRLPPFHLVGHSLGGAVALQFALAHPRKVRTLTLVTPAPATGLAALREGTSASARLMRGIDPEHGPSMAMLHASYRLQHALGTNRWWLRGALARMMPGVRLERGDAESLLDDAARMSPGAMVGFYRALHRWNVAGDVARLRVPTTILAGGKDALVPAAALEETAQLLPRGELVVWNDVGHSPQVERPDEFTALLVAAARRSWLMRLRTWWWRVRHRVPASLPREDGVADEHP